MTHSRDQKGAGDISSRVEGLIFAELPVEELPTDQAHGDRGERGSKKRGGSPDQNL